MPPKLKNNTSLKKRKAHPGHVDGKEEMKLK